MGARLGVLGVAISQRPCWESFNVAATESGSRRALGQAGCSPSQGQAGKLGGWVGDRGHWLLLLAFPLLCCLA